MPTVRNYPKIGRVVLYGKEYGRGMDRIYRQRAKQVSTMLLRRVRAKVSQPSPPRSRPGQYPRRVSGRLARSYFTTFAANGLSFRLKNRAPHSDFLEFEVRGGKIIRPKNARFLSWIGSGGKRVFAKQVRQGAIRGRQHIRRVIVESRQDIAKIWKTRVRGRVRLG